MQPEGHTSVNSYCHLTQRTQISFSSRRSASAGLAVCRLSGNTACSRTAFCCFFHRNKHGHVLLRIPKTAAAATSGPASAPRHANRKRRKTHAPSEAAPGQENTKQNLKPSPRKTLWYCHDGISLRWCICLDRAKNSSAHH